MTKFNDIGKINLKQLNFKLLIDSFIIFLNISNSYSIIPYLLFFQHSRIINTLIITIINVIFIVLRFKNKISFPFHTLFIIYILINILNVISGVLSNTFLYPGIAYLFSNICFYIILYNLYKKYNPDFNYNEKTWLMLRGYIWLILINIISVFALFFLINIIGINPLINNIGNSMDLFKTNIEKLGATYYFPYNLSILYNTITDIRIPLLQKFGFICGFYHEPHIITFMLTPALFFLTYKYKNLFSRTVIIVSFILIFLIAASTTNILAVLICYLVVIANKLRKKIVIPILVLIISFVVILSIDTEYYSFILYKLTSSSAEYSLGTIIFAFTPKTLFGTNFYNLEYLFDRYHNYDVGYIIFFVNILYLILFSFKIIRLNFSEIPSTRAIGLFSLYFFLHSMKIAMVTYSLSFLILVMFLLSLPNNNKNENPITKILY